MMAVRSSSLSALYKGYVRIKDVGTCQVDKGDLKGSTFVYIRGTSLRFSREPSP